jgi:large subunit ribosomal protein L13
MGRRPFPADFFHVMKTYAPKPRDIQRRWYVIDADGAVLGRLATEVASILKGKHKPIYAPNADTGDHVIVVNAKGIRVTGGKEGTKIAYRHSGYPGGLTETRYDVLLRDRPAFAIEKAVKGMLPKSSLGRSMLRKLNVYEGADHPHQAQKPESLTLGQVPRWDGLPALEVAKSPATEPAKGSRSPKPSAGGPDGDEAPVGTPTAKRSPAKKKTAAKTTAKSTAKKSAATTSAKRSSAKKTSSAKRSSKKE